MLEEALTSPTFPPGDASMALLEFVRYELPAGGSNAEARFFRLFSLLCDRLFGPMAGPKDEFRHEVGGWLSRKTRWDRSTSTAQSSLQSGSGARVPSQRTSPSSTSIDMDPVVLLLSGIDATSPTGRELPTLIDAISAEAEHRPGVRFQFPFLALPKNTQAVFLALIQPAMMGKVADTHLGENAVRLGGSLLRVHLKDQHLLKAYQMSKAQNQEQMRPLGLSPLLAFSPSQAKPPTDPNSPELSPKLNLSMLEFYLFTFVRYALATPIVPAMQQQGRVQSPGSRSGTGITHHRRRSGPAYGEQVYLHLFRSYLRHFLPLVSPVGTFLGYSSLTRESELFLRVVIEFWLDGPVSVPTIVKAAETIRQRRQRSGAKVGGSLDLNMAFELSTVKYDPLPSQVLNCFRSLINHAVRDSGISRSVFEVSESVAAQSASPRVGGIAWCLSPCMTTLQLPFYNFVRTTFRHASVHVSGSPFHTALESWLIWLEPWNVEMRKKNPVVNAKNAFAEKVTHTPRSQKQDISPVIVIPKPTHRSRYSKKWEPYIAANLHLYTVPLSIFLRRSRELDFSPRYFRRSLALVQRVLRVFSPEVVYTINQLLEDTGHPLASFVAKHNQKLGDFSPSLLGRLTLSSCGQDMHNLLEEMFSQHFKAMREQNIFDRLAAYIGVGDVTSSEEKDLQAIVEKAKLIVDFPSDYEVLPAAKKTAELAAASVAAHGKPERDRNGLLTDAGRQTVIEGVVRCTPSDVAYVGDKMKMRPGSCEIPQLVPWTIKASNYLNEKLGLVDQASSNIQGADRTPGADDATGFAALVQESRTKKRSWIRVDLRFLADYRNLALIVLATWFWVRWYW